MAENHFKAGQPCRVIEAHKPAPGDPLLVKAGEVLTVGQNDTQWPTWVRCTNSAGQSGWMPENYLDRSGDRGIARCDYDATELVAGIGEEVIVGYEEGGWIWCTNSRGQNGWLPADKVTGQDMTNEQKKITLKALQQIPGVGPRIAEDLWQLNFRSVHELAGRDPEGMYYQLCTLQGTQIDRCMLYVFRCAVYYASNRQHEPELLKWWNWKDDKLKQRTT